MPIPIRDYLRSLKSDLSEAEWTGNDKQAGYPRSEIERVQADIERGELWEVPF